MATTNAATTAASRKTNRGARGGTGEKSTRRQNAEKGFVASKELSARLQAVLVDLLELSMQGKQAHWNVVGRNFRDTHRQLDEIIEAARGFSDTVAERMRALHAVPDGRSATVAATTTLPEYPQGEVDTTETVDLITVRLEATVRTMREVHDGDDWVGVCARCTTAPTNRTPRGPPSCTRPSRASGSSRGWSAPRTAPPRRGADDAEREQPHAARDRHRRRLRNRPGDGRGPRRGRHGCRDHLAHGRAGCPGDGGGGPRARWASARGADGRVGHPRLR